LTSPLLGMVETVAGGGGRNVFWANKAALVRVITLAKRERLNGEFIVVSFLFSAAGTCGVLY
jgi:hypothetical protein